MQSLQPLADSVRQGVELVEDGLGRGSGLAARPPDDVVAVGADLVRRERTAGGLAPGQIGDPLRDAGLRREGEHDTVPGPFTAHERVREQAAVLGESLLGRVSRGRHVAGDLGARDCLDEERLLVHRG